MANVQILPKPKTSPMTCVVSGDGRGPVLDLGRDINGYGRLYVKIDAIAKPLRQQGWVDPDQAAKLRDQAAQEEARANHLQDQADKYQELVMRLADAAAEVMPSPEAEVITETRETVRDPTRDEIEQWLIEHPNHPLLRHYQPPEPGSAAEHEQLYGAPHQRRKAKHYADVARKRAEQAQQQQSTAPTTQQDHGQPSTPMTTQLQGQEVDIDALLAEKVADIIAFCEGHSEEFRTQVVNRELELADRGYGRARKGLITGLGFEFVEGARDQDYDQPIDPRGEGKDASADENDPVDEDEDELIVEDDEQGETP
jgi:hypothetical protein